MDTCASLFFFLHSALYPVPLPQWLIPGYRQLWRQPPDHPGRGTELQRLTSTELGAAVADGPLTARVPAPDAWRQDYPLLPGPDTETEAEPLISSNPPGHQGPPAEPEQRAGQHQPGLHPRRLHRPFGRGPGHRHWIVHRRLRLQPSGQQWTLVRDAEQPVADIAAVTQLPGVPGSSGQEVQQHRQPGPRGDVAVIPGQGGPQRDSGPGAYGPPGLPGQPLDRGVGRYKKRGWKRGNRRWRARIQREELKPNNSRALSEKQMKPTVYSSLVSPFLGSKPIAVPLTLSAPISEREAQWHMMSCTPKPNPHLAPLTLFLYICDKPVSYFVLPRGVVLVKVCWWGNVKTGPYTLLGDVPVIGGCERLWRPRGPFKIRESIGAETNELKLKDAS